MMGNHQRARYTRPRVGPHSRSVASCVEQTSLIRKKYNSSSKDRIVAVSHETEVVVFCYRDEVRRQLARCVSNAILFILREASGLVNCYGYRIMLGRLLVDP